MYLKYTSFSVYNIFPVLEIFQHFIWEKKRQTIQIVVKEHKEWQITWRGFNSFQIEAHSNSSAQPVVKNIRW